MLHERKLVGLVLAGLNLDSRRSGGEGAIFVTGVECCLLCTGAEDFALTSRLVDVTVEYVTLPEPLLEKLDD